VAEQLIFVTGNPSKLAEAKKVAKRYDIDLQSKTLEIAEIQSSDPMAVAKAKVKTAYQILQCPVITHDSSWSIPTLNGFPGAYMHDLGIENNSVILQAWEEFFNWYRKRSEK